MRFDFILTLFSSLAYASITSATPESWKFTLTKSEEPIHLQAHYRDTTILETLRNDGRFKKLLKLISENKDLKDDLKGDVRMTILAPTDRAMKNIPYLNVCATDVHDEKKHKKHKRKHKHKHRQPKDLKDLIRYHVIPEEVNLRILRRMRTIKSSLTLDTLNGAHQKHRITHLGDKTFIDFATVEKQMITKNGVILVIDRPLLPPPKTVSVLFQLSPFAYSTTLAAIYHSGLDKELDKAKGITIFAPTNMAWNSLNINKVLYLFSPFGRKDMRKVLLTHIVPELNYGTDMAGINPGDTKWLKTMNEKEEIEISTIRPGDHPRLTINNESLIIFPDGPTANGVVHAINFPIIPSNIEWRVNTSVSSVARSGTSNVLSFQ